MRLTMKPGVDFACTGVLPQPLASSKIASATARPVRSPDTTSTSFISGTGLKKCMPTRRPGCFSSRASAVIDSDEVFDASTASGAMMASSSRSRPCLTPRFSTMASTTRPASASSDIAPAGTMRAIAASAAAASSLPLVTRPSRVAFSLSRASRAAPSRASYRYTRCPACAATCTMPAPIVPAPITATVSKFEVVMCFRRVGFSPPLSTVG